MGDPVGEIKQCMSEIKQLQDTIAKIRSNAKGSLASQETKDSIPKLNLQMRTCKMLQGHFGKIYAMDWGADDITVLSAAQDGSLILWNAMTLNKRQMITLRSTWVMSCAVSPSGQLTASGGLDNICTIHKLPETADITEIKSSAELLEHTGYLSGAQFIDDSQILTCSGDATCLLWDIEKQKVTKSFQGEHESDVMDVSLFPGSSLFVSGSCDHTCKVWDLKSETPVLTFTEHESDINTVDTSRSGNFFIGAGDDCSIVLHDLRSYGPLEEYRSPTEVAAITSAAFSASGRVIFAGYDDNLAVAWDTLRNEKICDLNAHTNRVSCLGVNNSGTALCTGGWDVFLRVWA